MIGMSADDQGSIPERMVEHTDEQAGSECLKTQQLILQPGSRVHSDRTANMVLAGIRVGRSGRRSSLLCCSAYQGSCAVRTAVGITPPMVSRIRSRSLSTPVYFTTPSMFRSSGK